MTFIAHSEIFLTTSKAFSRSAFKITEVADCTPFHARHRRSSTVTRELEHHHTATCLMLSGAGQGGGRGDGPIAINARVMRDETRLNGDMPMFKIPAVKVSPPFLLLPPCSRGHNSGRHWDP